MLEIKVDASEAVQAISVLHKDLHPALIKGVLRAAYHVEGEIKREVYATFPEGRTGGLARSFRPIFLGKDGDTISAAVRSDLIYARIQDEGGTITAKSGKYLAVPINKRIAVGKWPRHFAPGELTLIPRKGKPPLLVKITGLRKNFIGPQMGKKWTPMFVLQRSVRLTAKNYIERAETKSAPGVEQILSETIEQITGKANGGGS